AGGLSRAEMEKVLIGGFFPDGPPDAEPAKQRAVGLQELGLPYASDPAITKHLASFLTRQAQALAERVQQKRGKKKPAGVTAVLFNGGVFKAGPVRQRVLTGLGHLHKGGRPKEPERRDPDRAGGAGAGGSR